MIVCTLIPLTSFACLFVVFNFRLSHMKRHDCEYLIQDIRDRGMVKEIERGRWMRLQKKAVTPQSDKGQRQSQVLGRKHGQLQHSTEVS